MEVLTVWRNDVRIVRHRPYDWGDPDDPTTPEDSEAHEANVQADSDADAGAYE